MKKQSKRSSKNTENVASDAPPKAPTSRARRTRHPRPTYGRKFIDPVKYKHPYDSMAQYADLLALRYPALRTRCAYYRNMRLIHEYYDADPVTLNEADLRDYLLYVKLEKNWAPRTLRQTVAAAQLFYIDLFKHADWEVFSQVHAKDHRHLPMVLTRKQVFDLLRHIRLRRYLTPLKLIYCCGLRLGECLSLTIEDIVGTENKLIIRDAKGNKYAKVVVMQR